MSYSLIANTIVGSSTDDSVTSGAINTTGADFIIIGASHTNIAGVTISDSKGNTYTPLTFYGDGTVTVRLHYCEVPSVGSGHTFTITTTGTQPAIAIAAFSGSRSSSAFDVENGTTTGVSPTHQPGSVTPSQDNELVVTCLVWNGAGTTASIDGGYTITNQIDKLTHSYGNALAYLIQTSAASTNPTWTVSGPGTSLRAAIATFKVAGGAGGSASRNLTLLGVG